MEAFAWELWVGIFRLECFAWELSFRIFRLGTFAWNIEGYFACFFALNRSLGIFHMEPFGIVRLETSSRLRQPAGSSVWILSLECLDEDLSLAIFGDLSLAIFRDLSLGNLGPVGWDCRLGFFAWERLFEIFHFESVDWKLSLEVFRLWTFA